MTINDPIRFCAGLWDWAILDGCFGETKIKPTDIDGFVERKGKFLAIETKAPEVEIPQGQEIMFKQMAKIGITVFVVWGTTNTPTKLKIFYKNMIDGPLDCNTEYLRERVSNWFSFADKD